MRGAVANRFEELWKRISSVQADLVAAGKIEYVDDLEKAGIQVRTFTDKIRTAPRGYAGLFNSIKINEKELEQLYTFDLAFFRSCRRDRAWHRQRRGKCRGRCGAACNYPQHHHTGPASSGNIQSSLGDLHGPGEVVRRESTGSGIRPAFAGDAQHEAQPGNVAHVARADQTVWREYVQPNSTDHVLKLLSEQRERVRVVAGATDLMLELERGVRRGVDVLVDITRLPGLNQIREDDDAIIRLGPLVTHNDCVASSLLRARAYPLARAAWEVGTPQIRNRGTVAGNVITASPANDTITPLMALGASVSLASTRGVRHVPLQEFYVGVRKTVMQPDEMLIEISFPALTDGRLGTFVKLALRRAQAISLVNAAVVLELRSGKVHAAAIALGAVAPTIIRVPAAEQFLEGKDLGDEVVKQAAALARDASRPIDDIRASADYRREMVRVATLRGLRDLRDGTERTGFPEDPVLLRSAAPGGASPRATSRLPVRGDFPSLHAAGTPIHTNVNGTNLELRPEHPKSLLRLLREDAGLTGTKEGCAEGECGACTVFLDGEAVMACLVPAPRADDAQITTVEGLAQNGRLHPVQQSFVQDAAVQCGYCTPGFIMAGAKLLEEKPGPQRNEIEQALTGNLCRCTGYYKIIKAVEDASILQGGG